MSNAVGFIEYTNSVIDNLRVGCTDGYSGDNSQFKTNENKHRIIVLGPGYWIQRPFIHVPKDGQDISDFCDEFRFNDHYGQADAVVMSRVFEHIPVRKLDWYLYQIASVMKTGATLHCVVPDMSGCARAISELFLEGAQTGKTNGFLAQRLTYELLSEGPHIWDRHATWTDTYSMKYYLELEGLFEVKKINSVRIDTDIIPCELEVVAVRK